jgi:hypothetical protein
MQKDMMDAARICIYEDTERGLKPKLMVYNDPDLANDILNYLNREVLLDNEISEFLNREDK